MSHVFPRHSHISAPIAVSGEGCYLIDSNGKRYLDGSGGAAVSCLGHNDADVKAAIMGQLDRLALRTQGFFQVSQLKPWQMHLRRRPPGR